MEKILLVEDTKSIIDLINTTLSQRGYQVAVALNGKEALPIAQKWMPGLILMDILMPEMDGYETCRLIKENPQTRHIPIIFLSALTKTFDKVKAFQLGGVDYISKPIETDELLARVKTHLTISRLQNELKEANEKLEEKVKQRTAELGETNTQLVASISELFEKTEQLIESEERYRYITESVTDYIYKVVIGNNGAIKTIHGATSFSVLGYTPDELNNDNAIWYKIIYPNDKERVISFFDQFLLSGQNETIEHRMIRKDGEIIWISDTLLAYHDTDGKLIKYEGIVKDITERKLLEQKILFSVIETEEKERLRFAQELHDGIGPLLSTINMYVEWILKPESKANKDKTLEKVHAIVKETHESIREISFNLSPHILQNFGLIPALKSYIERIKESKSINIDLKTERYNRNNLPIETIIYRILTECITNTIKHAQSSTIIMKIIEDEEKITINFEDNGKGFNLDEIKHTGLGLTNMQSRLQSINGKLNIESSIGKGTRITIEIDK